MGYSRKKQPGEVEDKLFEKILGIFRFFTSPFKIPDKQSFTPRNYIKLFVFHIQILRPKTKTLGNIAFGPPLEIPCCF